LLSYGGYALAFYHINPIDDDTFIDEKLQFGITFFQNLLIQFVPNPLLHGTSPMGFFPLSNASIPNRPILNTPPLLAYECPPPFLTPLVDILLLTLFFHHQHFENEVKST